MNNHDFLIHIMQYMDEIASEIANYLIENELTINKNNNGEWVIEPIILDV